MLLSAYHYMGTIGQLLEDTTGIQGTYKANYQSASLVSWLRRQQFTEQHVPQPTHGETELGSPGDQKVKSSQQYTL